MCRNMVRALSLVLSLVLLLTVGGVWAVWTYYEPPEPVEEVLSAELSYFRFPDIFIRRIEPVTAGGTFTKTGDTTATANITTGGTSFTVTFYNDSDITYYFNKAETKSGNGNYTISGIEKGDKVTSKTELSITVTFSGVGNPEIFFHFVVNPDDVETVVARTAVDRFREILNTAADYGNLTGAMDSHSGSSKVTYIGNVVGADSSDSNTVENLFGDEFMSMDLDGDGKTERITMMIKRENLDSDVTTGAPYSYSGWFGQTTEVEGAEMTIYITAQDLSNVSSGTDITVYAAVFTKYPGEDEWVELVPLTKGVADANNYNGWGTSANSFNTDTWVSDGGQTLRQIIAAQN